MLTVSHLSVLLLYEYAIVFFNDTATSQIFTLAIPYTLFFFNDTATTEIYTLSLHDALPIYHIDMAKKHLKKETASAVIAAVRRGGGEGAPIGETAYRRIRSDIVFGKLPPGQKLTLDRMKEAYNASVSTLREILNRPPSEGFIKAESAKGF